MNKIFHVHTSVCNPEILNSRTLAIFDNPKSRHWQLPNPEIQDYKNLLKLYFLVLNDTSNKILAI